MLTTILVLAILAWGLAFKVKNLYGLRLCTGPITNNCPNFTYDSTITDDCAQKSILYNYIG